MKAQLKIKYLLVAALGIFSLGIQAQAAKLGASVDYPVAIGTTAQGFTSNLGLTLDFYVDPILDPKIDNFISIGYRSFTIRADGESSYRVIPVLVGLELPGRISDDIKITVSGAIGGAATYINVPGLNSIKMTGNFAAQLKSGIAWNLSKDFAITGEVPITYLISSKSFSFVSYSLGAQFAFGGGESSSGRQ